MEKSIFPGYCFEFLKCVILTPAALLRNAKHLGEESRSEILRSPRKTGQSQDESPWENSPRGHLFKINFPAFVIWSR
jgi:hypothetical protein